MLSVIIGWVLGMVSAIITEPLRAAVLGPKLKIEIGDTPEFKTRTPEQITFNDPKIAPVPLTSVHEAEYLRIKVTNTRRAVAKQCRAYLTNVEKTDEKRSFPIHYLRRQHSARVGVSTAGGLHTLGPATWRGAVY